MNGEIQNGPHADSVTVYVPAADHIRVERLSDLTLVFHRLSSETHILSPDMDAIFAGVPARGGTAADILNRLQAAHGAVEADEPESGETTSVHEVIAARLEELAALGLLHRLSQTSA